MHIVSESAPLVSICIPVYNGEKYLAQALESCIVQTYPNVEIIVCDDRSSDKSIEVISTLSSPLIRVHHNEKNLGLVGNWKKCIEMARGEWIKFMFQDDFMKSDCVSKMIDACKQDGTRMAICAREFVFEENADEEIKKVFTYELTRPEELFSSKRLWRADETYEKIGSHLIENVLGEPICLLFHKDLYHEIGGFDASYRQMVDYEFALKAILNHPFSFLSEKLVSFRIHQESTTGKNVTQIDKRNKNHNKIDASIGDYIRLLESYLIKKEFAPMRLIMGEDKIRLHQEYIFLRACRYSGAKRVRTALGNLLSECSSLKKCRYNIVKYKLVKRRYKKEVMPFLNV